MKKVLETLAWIFVLSLGVTHCATESGDSGSQTHWLYTCSTDADCNGALTCECGLCTQRCTTGSACADLGRSATCVSATSAAHEALCGVTPAPSLCLPSCGSGCQGGESCIDGACVPGASASDAGAGGSDGGGTCDPPRQLVYGAPGCGGSVKPVCAGPGFLLCVQQVCGCDGVTQKGCFDYPRPWAHLGACP